MNDNSYQKEVSNGSLSDCFNVVSKEHPAAVESVYACTILHNKWFLEVGEQHSGLKSHVVSNLNSIGVHIFQSP